MKKEFYIGFVCVVAGALLWFGIKFLSGDNNPFKKDKNFFAFYSDLAGLEVSDNVYYKGSNVGQVRKIRLANKADKLDCFTDGGWIVEVSIDIDGVLEKIKKNTVLEIYDSDLLGSKGIKIVINSDDYKSKIDCFKESKNQAKPGDYLNAYLDKGLIDDLTLEFTKQLGSLGSVQNEISNFLDSFTATLNELTELSITVDTILNANEKNIESLMTNMNDFSASLPDSNEVNKIVSNLTDLEIKQTTQKLNVTLDELKLLLSNINNGDGTASKIIQDKDLYDAINKTLDSMRSLMEDIEKNPKKYIKHVL